ncbi:hypothetical protein DB346_18640 [Verrucomicrobia bacterium LW23]|nr:hypothetical protein DB346_18640 [Verrucomicrobia bacterium LW23]
MEGYWKLICQVLDAGALVVIAGMLLNIWRRVEAPVALMFLTVLAATTSLSYVTDSYFHDNLDATTVMVIVTLACTMAAHRELLRDRDKDRKRREGDESDDAYR